MAFISIRHCLRQQSRSINPFHWPSFSQPVSSTSLNSTYYVQSFLHSDDQYILLFPHPSTPMGRIRLSTPPRRTNISTSGPTVEFIDPISSDAIKTDWSTFVENGGFREILQNVVMENIAQEETIINDAKSLQGGDGWVHLCDERALPA